MILMKQAFLFLRKVFIIVYLLAIHLFAALFVYERFLKPYFAPNAIETANVQDPTEKQEAPPPVVIPSIVPEETPVAESTSQIQSDANQTTTNANAQSTTIAEAAVPSGKIMIPVVGVRREQIRDTFNDARSEGRVHNANDIMAAGGTPIVACADGEIAKFFDSARGGITIYQFSSDHKFVYYYAHLQRRADNVKEHDFVKQGTVIGYVGDTGDAAPGNYHLHFEIMIAADPQKYYKGTDINPYPLLKDGIESH